MAVFLLACEYDIANTGVIGDWVRGAPRHGATAISLDMAAVTFLYSSAVNALVTARGRRLGAGATLTVASPSRPVARLLAVMGLTDGFA